MFTIKIRYKILKLLNKSDLLIIRKLKIYKKLMIFKLYKIWLFYFLKIKENKSKSKKLIIQILI
jgi:hypothetical protein